MPLYFGDYGVVKVRTDSAGVHHLPFGWVLVTGETPPAAAPGAKNLSTKARCKISSYCQVGMTYYLAQTLRMKVSATCDLHTGRVELDATLRTKWLAPRCVLVVGEEGDQVDFIAAGTGGEANNNGFSLTPPTRTAGDFLLVILGVRYGGTGTLSTSSSGWNAASMFFTDDVKAWWRIATNDSNDNFTATYTGGGSNETVVGRIFSYSNVHATTPFEDYEASHDFSFTTVNGASGANQQYVGGDVPNDSGFLSHQYGALLTFAVLDDNNTATTPALTNNTYGTYPNTTEETAQFPFTLTGWHASTLGSDASLIAWHSKHLPSNPDIPSFAAWGNYSWTTAGGSTASVVWAGLRPANGAPAPAVWLDSSQTIPINATCTLSATSGVRNLDGVLSAHQTASLDLQVLDGKKLDGILYNKLTPQCTLTTVSGPGRLEGIIRNRMVGNVAVLSVGTTHTPSGMLPVKWSAGAILTINYMRCLMVVPWRVWCNLDVNLKLSATLPLKQTATLDLTRGPSTGGGFAGLHWTGTARLDLPLRASVHTRWLASVIVDAQRRFAGSATERISAPASLSVIRTFGASAGARQMAAATLTSVRAVAGQARLHSTASASLTSDRHLAGSASILWRAYLAMQPVRPVRPPETDITISPYTPPVDSESLPVEVESPSGTVHVEGP